MRKSMQYMEHFSDIPSTLLSFPSLSLYPVLLSSHLDIEKQLKRGNGRKYLCKTQFRNAETN